MIRNVIEQIGGIGLYGIIALSLFFLFFAGMMVWVMRLRTPYLEHMSELPNQLDD